jgi:GDPmannose 4,6-dehydratase
VDEVGVNEKGEVVVGVDPRYFRPTEVETLLGDPSKAKKELGWTPTTTFEQLVAEMVDADLQSAKRDALVRLHGYPAYNVRES